MRDHLALANPSSGDRIEDLIDDPVEPSPLTVIDGDMDLAEDTDRWTSDPAADAFSARVEDEMRPLLDTLQRLRRRGLLD